MSDTVFPHDLSGSKETFGWAIVNVRERRRLFYFLTEQEAVAELDLHNPELAVTRVWKASDGKWTADWDALLKSNPA